MKKLVGGVALAVAFSAGFLAHGLVPIETVAQAQSNRMFELRTYTAADGKLQATVAPAESSVMWNRSWIVPCTS